MSNRSENVSSWSNTVEASSAVVANARSTKAASSRTGCISASASAAARILSWRVLCMPCITLTNWLSSAGLGMLLRTPSLRSTNRSSSSTASMSALRVATAAAASIAGRATSMMSLSWAPCSSRSKTSDAAPSLSWTVSWTSRKRAEERRVSKVTTPARLSTQVARSAAATCCKREAASLDAEQDACLSLANDKTVRASCF